MKKITTFIAAIAMVFGLAGTSAFAATTQPLTVDLTTGFSGTTSNFSTYGGVWNYGLVGTYKYDKNWTFDGTLGGDSSFTVSKFHFESSDAKTTLRYGLGATYNFGKNTNVHVGYGQSVDPFVTSLGSTVLHTGSMQLTTRVF
jgi:hypothetical protein